MKLFNIVTIVVIILYPTIKFYKLETIGWVLLILWFFSALTIKSKKLISKEGIRDINGKPIRTAKEFLKAYEGKGIRIPKKGLK